MPSLTSSDGIRLDYTETGSPTGRPVVLIAGFRAPATSWAANRKALERAGYRVIAFDTRGHGLSDSGELADNTMAQRGADLRQLIAELGLRDAVLVGGSMGGNTVWAALAEEVGADAVAGVVIVDQTPQMLNSPDWPHGFYDYEERVRDSFFAGGIPDPGRVAISSKGIVRIVRLFRALDVKRARVPLTPSELKVLNDHAQADWRPVIARTTVPVLFVAGDASEFWPSSHAAAAAALAPRGESIVIAKDGHAANIEQPKAFNELLLGFIGRLPA